MNHDSPARLGPDEPHQPDPDAFARTMGAVSRLWAEGTDPVARAARAAIARGAWRAITNRTGTELYLARFWLSDPRALPDGRLDSGDSLLLHFIARPDDGVDAHGAPVFHDHPWQFRSTVLRGGYLQERLSLRYGVVEQAFVHEQRRYAGSVETLEATATHRIATVEPDTWTLVETRAAGRVWGFRAARCGAPWVDWRTFLGHPAATPGDREVD